MEDEVRKQNRQATKTHLNAEVGVLLVKLLGEQLSHRLLQEHMKDVHTHIAPPNTEKKLAFPDHRNGSGALMSGTDDLFPSTFLDGDTHVPASHKTHTLYM